MCRAQGLGARRGDNLVRLTVWTGAGTGVGEGSRYFHGTAATATAQAADPIAAGEVGGVHGSAEEEGNAQAPRVRRRGGRREMEFPRGRNWRNQDKANYEFQSDSRKTLESRGP